jgi:hypothetical protein
MAGISASTSAMTRLSPPMVIPLSTPTWKLSFVRADESSVVEVFEDLAISLELRVVITGLAGFGRFSKQNKVSGLDSLF